jgi:addiction module HigA family antidote
MTIRRDDLDAGRVDLADVIDTRRPPMKPVPPGEILRTEFLNPMKLSAYRLAKDINVPLNRIPGILAGKRAITADTALRFARYFRTDAQSWINLQARYYDLEVTRQACGRRIDREVKPRAA